jgi:O-antigen ligase
VVDVPLIRNFSAKVILIAVMALALGGIGGSLQPSRVFLLTLLPVILIKLRHAREIPWRHYSARLVFFSFMLLLLGFVTLIWSIDRILSIGYLIVLAINLLPLVSLALMTDHERTWLREKIPKAWLLSATGVLPLALYEITTGNHFELGLQERGGGTFSILPFASGLHGNYNDFSIFLLMCLFGICHMNASTASPWWRRFAVVIGTFIVMVILFNASRGAIFALLGLLVFRFARELFSKRGLAALASIVLATAIVGGTADGDEDAHLQQYLMLKLSDYSNDLEGDEGRLAIASAGLDGIIETLGLGVGAGASSAYLATKSSVVIPNPHNLILEWGMNFGVFGLVMLAWFLLCTWTASRNVVKSSRQVIYIFILLMPLCGVAQSHLTGYTYFWLALLTTSAFASPRWTPQYSDRRPLRALTSS